MIPFQWRNACSLPLDTDYLKGMVINPYGNCLHYG